jgi:hypothetical protein
MFKPAILTVIKMVKCIYGENVEINFKINYNNFDEILPNDILIWVGPEGLPDFDSLREKNIYTVYYNTEPYGGHFASDEIWTYSKYVYDHYEKSRENQVIKFVPIIAEELVPSVPYYLKKDNLKIIFIGLFSFRSAKEEKINNTTTLIKNNLVEKYDLWTDTDYNDFMSSAPNIFLSIGKYDSQVLPSVRINKLLSHKAIIISEHTNDIDEEYYDGMVYFCNIEEMDDIYRTLMNKTAEELQQEADDKYKRFYEKFYYKNASKMILEK